MTIAIFLDSMQMRLPFLTRWAGRLGVLLGPVLCVLHLFAASIFPPYGRLVLTQYDAVLFTGSLLAAPTAQYFILLGSVFSILWVILWAVRCGLALRSWIIRRRVA
ncbi:hypothetical protein CXG45_27220 [Pseudomonas plecoglossicida]|uniref:Uncharacterized protein n=1 Tax=Pseudomonas plecoglossicida TaxID=70775 RepID=A0ABX4TWZ9_PSEDL|nr:hypothetical protein CXG44_26865 [Pseudomonas plecoglossicida]PLU89576.1 hypothetical protein CXG45_27220 [Pseudomonas plecoglossicida]PLU97641.1 hypothetical protein CXG48_27195 [Pseudomonas plecoglossicida]PLV07551.1 hypothetical protein CXG47_27365 [Pseudomonas plecoglossicida]